MSEAKPNLLIFVAEQWRGRDVGCLGSPVVKTPSVDALAAEGVAFTHAFTQNPVCTPSRCAFMTGWYPHVRGHRDMHHMLAPEEPCLLKELKDALYHVLWGGKNDLLRVDDLQNAYTRFIERGAGSPWGESPWKPEDRLYHSFLYGRLPDGYRTSDDVNCEAAAKFLREGPPEPFCIYLPLVYPHPPFAVEEPYYSMYDRDALPPLAPTPDFSRKPRLLSMIRERARLEEVTEQEFREIRAVYYGMITKTDTNLGKVLTALRAGGLWEETAVFFFADHGEYAGDYGLVEKAQNTFEDCLVNVPLVVKLAGENPAAGIEEVGDPTVSDALVELVDFYPTVVELAGLPDTHTQFGRSLLPLLLGETDTHRDVVFSEGGTLDEEEHTHEQRRKRQSIYWPRLSAQNLDHRAHGKAVMVRNHRWKYVRRLYEMDELYDLETDPQELVNLSDDAQYADIIAQLSTRMLDWFLATGDVVPYELDERWPGEPLGDEPDYDK